MATKPKEKKNGSQEYFTAKVSAHISQILKYLRELFHVIQERSIEQILAQRLGVNTNERFTHADMIDIRSKVNTVLQDRE